MKLLDADKKEVSYAKGIGSHAPGELAYDLTGTGIVRFQAYAGVDRSSGSSGGKIGTVEFQVYVDGVLVETSGILTKDQPAHYFDIDLKDAKNLRLVMTDGGDGNTCDHANWCDAKVTVDQSLQGQLDGIKLKASKTWLNVGDTASVEASGIVILEDAIDLIGREGTVFSSSNEDVASVDSATGALTAKADGVATITCTASYGGKEQSASFNVIVGNGDAQSSWVMTSPDGSVKTLFALNNGAVTFTSAKDGDITIENSPTGLVTNLGDFSNGLSFVSREDKVVEDSYELFGAKKKYIENTSNETTLNFEKDGVGFSIIVRSYDDGMAFRYAINAADQGEVLTISSEKTGYQLPQGSVAQAMDYINHHEAVAYEKTLAELRGNYLMPLLYETPAGTWTLLSEAALSVEYCGAMIQSDGTGLAKVVFSPEQKSDVETTSPFVSPWRFAVMGTPSDINENVMAENLSPELALEDASWIKPGVTSWTWLNREATNSYEVYKKYVDFSAEMGWDYLLLDEGWQPKGASGSGFVYDGYYDWTYDLLDYAKEKGVGLIAWQNHNDLKTEAQQERIAELAQMGFVGIKPDFFNSQSQDYIKLYHQLMQKTAENHIMINIHGANKTTGERRTYPNAITREGVFGHEQDLFRPTQVSATHNCMLPFTRNAVGPADYTPMLSYRNSGDRRPFTTAHMAALPVIFESGIQCMADRPEVYRDSPAYEFFKNMPCDWDDTVMVDGDPGEYANIARRSGDTWYMGIICNEQRTAEFSLDFLGEGKYYAFIYKDGETIYDIDVEMKEVTREDTLSIPMLATGGAGVKLTKTLPTQADSITLSTERLDLEQYATGTITATLNPADVEMTQVNWTSSNPAVATVTGGKVTALKPGRTTITASTGFGGTVTASCEVIVTIPRFSLTEDWSIVRNDVTHWALNDTNSITITTQAGELYSSTTNAQNIFLTPASGDFTVTTKLTFVPGADYQTAGIIVYANDKSVFGAFKRSHSGFNGNILATFSQNNGSPSEQTTPDPDKNAPVYLKVERVGTSFSAYYSFDNENWTKIKNSVTNAALSASDLKVGLYAVDGNGKSGTLPATFEDFTVNGTVIPFATEYIAPEAIELSKTETTMVQYTEETLTANILPAGAAGTITWVSSDPEVASVENGKIRAHKPGKAAITAMTGFDDEITASCEVTVTKQPLALSQNWNVLRSDPFNWKINSKNSLTVISQDGEYYPGKATAKNVFLTDVGTEDFTVTTKLDFAPTGIYQTAGIMIHADEDTVFGVYRRYHTGFGGNILATVGIENGKLTEQSVADPDKDSAVYLKVVKEGSTFTAFYSFDNDSWTQIGEAETHAAIAASDSVQVGTYTANGSGRVGAIPATYEDFTINGEVIPFALPGDADGDGRLGVSDLVSLKSVILGRDEMTDEQMDLCDMNGDGRINIFDLLAIKLAILNG